MGTTSACAENTHGSYYTPLLAWNYLRVRGEYLIHSRVFERPQELPPRARRIPWGSGGGFGLGGTTSACAENTALAEPSIPRVRNYLRVRGEYVDRLWGSFIGVELPPRARRILLLAADYKPAEGTTSACAENTATAANLGLTGRNYLRVRGEYSRNLSMA